MAFVPFVYFKTPETDVVEQADISTRLNAGETITAVSFGAVDPGTSPALTVTLQSAQTSPVLQFLLSGGVSGTSYGFKATVTTSARVLIVVFAVTAQDPQFSPYTTSNPEAFQDLVDQIEAGRAALGTSIFAFPPTIDPAGGFVVWDLLDSNGDVYAGGNAYDYTIRSTGASNIVTARSIINVPSTVPPTMEDQKYQIRYTLQLPQEQGLPPDPLTGAQGQNVFFQYENVRVVGLNTVPLGTAPSAEIQGVPATLSIVLDKPYDNVTVEIWANGKALSAPFQVTEYERTANGWFYSGVIETSQFKVSLAAYQVIWKYWASSNSGVVYQEYADLFITNPSIMGAVDDMKAKINKARTTLYGTPDLLYPVPTCLKWLRRGADAFNGAFGQFTNFSMTNAQGVIREFWLLESEMAAIEAQYLAEGEKAFNFQGAAIALEVDRTQYLEAAAERINGRLNNELKDIKVNLIIKGATQGDGSADPTALQPGAIGAVGITISPASMYGRYGPGVRR